jgi:hypothetical protein
MGLRVSPKHGLNPSIETCFLCGQPKGVALFGVVHPSTKEAFKKAGNPFSETGEAPREVCLDMEPCSKCQEHMSKGIIMISVREPRNKEEEKNPYRTGGWVVVKEEAVKRFITPLSVLKTILKKRVAFVPDEAWDMIGLPRGQ